MKTENWKKVRLGDFVKIRTGKLDANASSDDGKYPFFTCSIEPLKISTYSYDCECVLVAGNGDLNVKYYNGKFDAYQRTYIIESLNKNILDVKFLYTFLSLYIETLRKLSIGGVIKYIKLANLTEALIPLPSLEIQKKISKTIKKSEKIIEENKQLLEKYDLLIKSRFIEMFGDNPIESGKWIIKELCSLSEIGSSKRIFANEYVSEGIPFYRSKEIRELGNGERPSIELYISCEKYNEIKTKYGIPKKNEILIAAIGATIGYTWIIDTDSPFYYKDGNLILISNIRELNSIFLNEILKIEIQTYKQKTSGSAQLALTIEKMEKLQIPVPPLSLQNQFADFVQQVDKSKFEYTYTGVAA